MRKLLISPLLITILFVPQQEVRANNLWDTVAAVATVGACALVASAAINYACTPYTDQQEFARAENLEHKAKRKCKKVTKYFRDEFNLLNGTTSYYITNYQSDTLSRMIRSWYNDLPFISYYSKVNSDLKTIKSQKNTVYSKIKHLKKRRDSLYKNEKLTSYERQEYRNKYNQLCYDLEPITRKLETLHSNLCNLYSVVKTLPGYNSDRQEQRHRKEEQLRREAEERRREEQRRTQEQVRQLERKIDNLRYERDHRHYSYDDCYISDLENQIRDLQNRQDQISFSFNW